MELEDLLAQDASGLNRVDVMSCFAISRESPFAQACTAAFAREALCDCASDTLARARDERCFSGELQIHAGCLILYTLVV
jgi:hypothetical protein